MASNQINLKPEDEFLEKFDRDLKRFGFKTRTAGAMDIIETFYEHWYELQDEQLKLRTAMLERFRQGNTTKRRTG